MDKKQKLSKGQRKEIRRLFIEQVSIPMLILSTTVLFTIISAPITGWDIYKNMAMALSAISIPMLAASIFTRRAVQIYNPNAVTRLKIADTLEDYGVVTSYSGFVLALLSVQLWLGLFTFIFTLFAVAVCFIELRRTRLKK